MSSLNPKILRTGFLAENGDPPALNELLGKRVALPISDSTSLNVTVVNELPADPQKGDIYLLCNDKERSDARMHNLVRFPAKLHPPFVKWAIEAYTEAGATVLDPYCGCGTVPLEATLLGRKAVGLDVDPYSALIAAAKCSPATNVEFRRAAKKLQAPLAKWERSQSTYERLATSDISESYYRRSLRDLHIPGIPRAEHWFKRYALIDLARIWRVLVRQRVDNRTKRFLKVSFASILRLCSNADPDTLSGLEVTRRMRERLERGRYLNPFLLFRNRLDRNQVILDEFWQLRREQDCDFLRPVIQQRSAMAPVSRRAPYTNLAMILTSPPYCSAVEYDRRHLLEHYWLRFIGSEATTRDLRSSYIGRRNYVYGDSKDLARKLPIAVRQSLGYRFKHLDPRDNSRRRAIIKYFVDMASWLGTASRQLAPGGRLVLVIGDSTVRGQPIPTSELLSKLAPDALELETSFSYVLRNRSMQYSRWNHANVATENVLVFVNRQ